MEGNQEWKEVELRKGTSIVECRIVSVSVGVERDIV